MEKKPDKVIVKEVLCVGFYTLGKHFLRPEATVKMYVIIVTYMPVYKCAYIYMCIYIHIYVYIYVYICIYTYVCIYMYIYIYVCGYA